MPVYPPELLFEYPAEAVTPPPTPSKRRRFPRRLSKLFKAYSSLCPPPLDSSYPAPATPEPEPAYYEPPPPYSPSDPLHDGCHSRPEAAPHACLEREHSFRSSIASTSSQSSASGCASSSSLSSSPSSPSLSPSPSRSPSSRDSIPLPSYASTAALGRPGHA